MMGRHLNAEASPGLRTIHLNVEWADLVLPADKTVAQLADRIDSDSTSYYAMSISVLMVDALARIGSSFMSNETE
jgi:hypothetical protein